MSALPRYDATDGSLALPNLAKHYQPRFKANICQQQQDATKKRMAPSLQPTERNFSAYYLPKNKEGPHWVSWVQAFISACAFKEGSRPTLPDRWGGWVVMDGSLRSVCRPLNVSAPINAVVCQQCRDAPCHYGSELRRQKKAALR